jgi:broad specificity phosphatase PhoE
MPRITRRHLLTLVVLGALTAGCPERPKAPAATTILLVRHGQSWKNVPPPPELKGDQLDALTPKGRDEIAAVASELAGRGAKRLVTSPLGRTRETAAILGSALGLTPVVEPSLATLESGETPERALRFVRSLAGGGTVVLVTHGDIIAAVLAEAAKTPEAEREKKHQVPTGSWSEVALDDGLKLVRQAPPR